MGFNSKRDSKRVVIYGLITIFIVIFSSMIFAGFQTGTLSHSIEKSYGPLFNISGWINISFDEEPKDSLLSSFFDGSLKDSVGLEELLDENPAYTYSCIPADCNNDYSTINGASSKNFVLAAGGSKILGLRISSSLPIQSVSSFSMNINSNALSSSTSQLTIDILNDDEINWRAYKPHANDQQEKDYGCFAENETEGSAEITATQYCQKISLPAFPQIRIGADVQEIAGGNVNFTISISNETLGIYKSCTQEASGSGQIDCIISDLKTTQPQDFFVCIKTTNAADNNKYGVKYEQNNPCGFTGLFENKYTYDFKIFAQTSFYDAIGNFVLNNTEMQNSGGSGMIENKILDYINQKYGGDCSDECVIPLVFRSNTSNHGISVSNVSLSYMAGISSTTKTLYDLTEDFPKISSDYQRLFIDKAGFSIPSEIGNYSFSLKLNSQEIFSESIEVKEVPIIKSLTPKTTAAGFSETFIVNVVSPMNVNISGYNWDFGDNNTMTTPINKVIHIYSEIGTYNLKVTVIDEGGFNSSKTFEINVTSPKNLIQNTLNKLNINLQNLKGDIQSYGWFQQTSLNSALKIENVSSELEKIKQESDAATNISEYIAILEDLLKIKLPEKIFKTKQANSFLFLPEKSSIDMDIVQSLGGGEYDSNKIENYRQAVMAWQQENVDLTINFNEFSGEYDSDIEPLVNVFEIKVEEKRDIAHDYYLIIPKLQDIEFSGNVNEDSGFFYVNLKDASGVNFYTTENVDFNNLPAFVAPPIDKLSVSSTTIFTEEGKKRRIIIFVLSMIFLVIIGTIAYMVIYHWYRKKYENYLFKRRNDLYNIVTYINGSKKRGLNNKEIIKNLKKAGWNSEQIRYVMRKYEGKRTGLVELPLMRLMKKRKKKKFSPKK